MKHIALLTLSIVVASAAFAQYSNVMDKKTFLSMIMQDEQAGPGAAFQEESHAYINQQEEVFSACAGKGYKRVEDKSNQSMTAVVNQCSAKLPEKINVMSPNVESQLAGFNQCVDQKLAKMQNISTETHRHCKSQTDPDIPMFERIERAKSPAEKQALIKLEEYEY